MVKVVERDGDGGQGAGGDRWQRQINTWDQVVEKFGLDKNRYVDFEYLLYLDLYDPFVENYVKFQLGSEDPIIKFRIRHHYEFWESITDVPWILDVIKNGVALPFEREPPNILLPNNRTVIEKDAVGWVRETIKEYLSFGFIKRVDSVPKCVMPLQVKDTGGKKALIFDMSVLNEYVAKGKFKLEGWEEMFNFASNANFAIKFDLKKFYHEIDIRTDMQTFFGFMYQMEDGCNHDYFVWETIPYGYTRAPFIAKSLMKPLVTRWRRMGIKIVVFYDDGMAVGRNAQLLRRMSLQIQCDLLRAGLVPGVGKCIWLPEKTVSWNGLIFDFVNFGLKVMPHRIDHAKEKTNMILENWPNGSYRDIAQFLGQLNSMHPVLAGNATLYTKMLQAIVNIRHFHDYPWTGIINSVSGTLLEAAFSELKFWKENMDTKNFRPFKDPLPDACGWVDASDRAIGGVLVRLLPLELKAVPCTIDNWLLDGAGLLPRLHSCADLQAGVGEQVVRPVVDHGLDPAVVRDVFLVHRNLQYVEMATDSNERELLAAVELNLGCLNLIENTTLTLHFDNMNAASICEQGSSKFRLHRYATYIASLCNSRKIRL